MGQCNPFGNSGQLQQSSLTVNQNKGQASQVQKSDKAATNSSKQPPISSGNPKDNTQNNPKEDKKQVEEDKTKDHQTNESKINTNNLPKTQTGANGQIPFNPVIHKKLSKSDFQWFSKLGKGAFGEVFLVKKIDDPADQRYAMKILNKADIQKKQLVIHTVLEQTVLKNNKNQFLVDLKYSFQTPTKIYFLMEYLEGGDLFKLLQQVKKFDVVAARFIVAQVILGVKHMHEVLKIKYRDLKPENIMLTKEGYIKIIDFGLARMFEKKTDITYTMAGTPEYLAPEIVLKKGHTKDVDLWALGILLFELMEGRAPFTDKNRNFDKIQKLIIANKPVFPPHFSPETVDLISKFLVTDPIQRIGSSSFQDVLQHPFFKDFDWDALIAKTMPSPLLELMNKQVKKQVNTEPRQLYETPAQPGLELMNIIGITYNPDNNFGDPERTRQHN